MTDPRLEAAKKKFSRLLKEIFQFDSADLDFGIYRILAMRRTELEKFLDTELLPQVEGILGGVAGGDRASIVADMKKLEDALEGVGDFSISPKWRALKEKLDAQPDVAGLTREVFSDLTTFFSRYYDEGDFMALPRYKAGTYAIPYDGSEVKLHWANADQYYIKTTERHADYVAVLEPTAGLKAPRLKFRLHRAESDRDNNKSKAKRAYVLRSENPVEVEGETLTVWFEYRAVEGAPNQEALCTQAEEAVLAAVSPDWRAALSRPKAERTTLAFQLYRYTRKSTADYFIHKDLGGFLSRELDFFIKNEVLFLDDIEGRTAVEIEVSLQKVKAIRAVGRKIIAWLAQMEGFQKRLYLKRKFILRTQWVIGIDRLPGDLRTMVEANEAQNLAWQSLYRFDPQGDLFSASGSRDGLTFDSQYFDLGLTHRVLASLSDAQPTGTMMSGDNAQALRLLAQRGVKVDAVYIDPPYNAKTSEIAYKNTFKHSAWLTMMADRVRLGAQLLAREGGLAVAIDENERDRLGLLLEEFALDRDLTCVAVQHNPRGIQGSGLSYTHEYGFFLTPKGADLPLRQLDEDKAKPLMKTGSVSMRSEGLTMFYPIYVRDGQVTRVGPPPPEDFHPDGPEVAHPNGEIELWPLDSEGGERKWRYKGESLMGVKDKVEVRSGREGRTVLYLAKSEEAYRTMWSDSRYNAAEHGSTLLTDMAISGFSFPKSIHTARDTIEIVLNGNREGLVLDYFGGSGTTGHAVLQLNNEDHGHRRFALIEMGEYFDSALVPRILRATYALQWKNGSPQSTERLSPIYKIAYIESYEDTLENLTLQRAPQQTELVFDEQNAALREDYHLHYQLDLESQGSLLDLARFRKPWHYTIKVRRDGVLQDSPVDLVETFNYLLGLRVKRYDTFGQEGLLFVTGTDPDGQNVIVVWRDCDLWPNETLEKKCEQAFESFRPIEFDQVYINGDHHLPALPKAGGRWKVNLTEETFHARMFDTSDVE